ncbi:MAG: AAA family ATPase [Verrucomicrobia bacterium]|nr:AAA family ATPase [Verrucomicrobiota bacterium]
MNLITPRVFIAATRQNDGKTTTSLGLLSALQKQFPRIGYIKPVGQRFVEIAEQKIDEDTVLMDAVYQLNCPLVDMSPIAVEPDFTRKYLSETNNDALVRRIQKSFDRVAWEKDFVLCEGSGHAGVGAVFDLSNAQVAKVLGAKVVIVTRGGIGKPVDEVALNQALFEKHGVEVIGVIVNKVLPDKLEYIAEFTRKGLKRKGLELLGVLPLQPILVKPTLASIRDELDADVLCSRKRLTQLVEGIVVAAMGANNVAKHFRRGTLVITPGDREDIVLAAAAAAQANPSEALSGLVLTDNLRPSHATLEVIRKLDFPLLLAEEDSYEVASKVHDIIVKTRPADAEKISVIRDLIAQHVDVAKLVGAL